MKVAIMLEECGFAYKVVEVDIGRGDQFRPEFLRISPNNKIPALVDHDGAEGPVELFESGAILVYLAAKARRLAGRDEQTRFAVLQWLFWQVGGLGPMAGQANHFRAFAPERVEYGIRRYTDEVNRLYGVMELRLQQAEFLAGEYSIADIACWPWIVPHRRQGQDLADFPALRRWFDRIRARPAVQRGFALGNERLMDPEGYDFLYGQTASVVAGRRQSHETADDGD